MAAQSLKCDGRKKMEQSIPSVVLTNCDFIATRSCGHAIFACYESTLAVHSENPFMVSNLTTGNSGQLKMSPKFRPSQKRRFWIWPFLIIYAFLAHPEAHQKQTFLTHLTPVDFRSARKFLNWSSNPLHFIKRSVGPVHVSRISQEKD